MKRKPGNRFLEDSTYFVTMTLKECEPLFADSAAAERVVRELQHHRQRRLIELYAYVVMPEHVHAVLRPIPPLVLPKCTHRSGPQELRL